MPFTGGATPSPERYGGGEGNSNVPLVQRVYESLAGARGSAYDQAWPPTTAVGAENLAYARAIALDGYGGNQRLWNNFIPSKTTSQSGMLQRWESIFGVPPNFGDPDIVRQARVAAAWARLGVSNSHQPIADLLAAALGPVFVSLSVYSLANRDVAWWPGNSGTAASITAQSGNKITVGNLANVTADYQSQLLMLSGCATSGNNATGRITDVLSSSSVNFANPSGSNPDANSGAIIWAVINPFVNWSSCIASVTVQCKQPVGYSNAQLYAALSLIGPILEQMLPAWATWQFALPSSDTTYDFILDDPANLDREVFGS